MEQEEAGQIEMGDHAQLLLQADQRLLVAPASRVALLEHPPAELGERAIRLGILRSRVAVAEVLGQIEAEALGQAPALLHGIGVLAEALNHALGGREHV